MALSDLRNLLLVFGMYGRSHAGRVDLKARHLRKVDQSPLLRRSFHSPEDRAARPLMGNQCHGL